MILESYNDMVLDMVEKIGQHTHCHICGKAIPVSETLCSDECKQKYKSMIKKRKLWLYLMWAIILCTVVLLIVLPNI